MDLSRVVKEAFPAGLFDQAGKLLPEHTGETQTKLAAAIGLSRIHWKEVNAIALAVRAVGDLEKFEPAAAVTPKQKAAFDALAAEKAVPAELRALLTAAKPAIAKRRDLYALYGVISGTMDQLISNASLAGLNTEDLAVR
jgi:hypothetical protein